MMWGAGIGHLDNKYSPAPQFKIVFIQDYPQEYYSIAQLSSVLSANGYVTDVFIQALEKNILNSISKFNPDIAAFSVYTGSHLWALHLSRQIKSFLPNVKIIFGGPHPTFVPEIVKEPEVDAICIGEGEYALLEFADAIRENKDYRNIKNLAYYENGEVTINQLRGLVVPLEQLPFPDRAIYNKYRLIRDSKTKGFIASRGCPFNCSFCSAKAYRKLYKDTRKYVRRKSPQYFVEEIKQTIAVQKIKTIRFDDDVFISDKKWLTEFIELYKSEVGIPFFCEVRADLISKEIVELIKSGGCYGVSFGVESGNEDLRNIVLNKKLSDEQIIKAASIIKKAGLKLRTSNMFVLPMETEKDAMKTVYLNQKIKTDYPFGFIYKPLPGTQLYGKSKQDGSLDKKFSFDDLSILHIESSAINNPDKKQIMYIQRLFPLLVRVKNVKRTIKIIKKITPSIIVDAISNIFLLKMYKKYKRESFFIAFVYSWKVWRLIKKQKS